MTHTDSPHVIWAVIVAPFVLFAGYIGILIFPEVLRTVFFEVVHNVIAKMVL